MRKNFQNFHKNLFNIFRTSLNINKNNNSKILKNTEKMQNLIIRKGHYQNINSFNNSKDIPIETIKILGEDVNNPGYWKTDELVKRNNVLVNKTISEYELTNNWVLLNTSTEEQPKTLPNHLLAGLNETSDENILQQIEEIKEIPIYKPYKNNDVQNIPDFKPFPIIPEDEKFIHNVLSKIKIPQKESIELKIRIPIDYNFIKLKETINLLNLDINKVINFILSSEETKLLINEKMKDKIFEMLMEENIEQKISEEKILEIEVIEPEIIVNNHEIKDLMRSQLPNNELENQTIKSITSTEDIRIKNLLNKVSKFY